VRRGEDYFRIVLPYFDEIRCLNCKPEPKELQVRENILSAVYDAYDQFYKSRGHSNVLKREAVKLIKEFRVQGGKMVPSYFAVAAVALQVASERVACPIDAYLMRWMRYLLGKPYRKLLRKFREISPRKERDYYFQCAFRRVINGVKRRAQEKGYSEVLQTLSEPGVPSKIYDVTFILLSSLPDQLLNSRNPETLMAGLCYIVFNIMDIRISIDFIAPALSVSNAAIRDNYRRIIEAIIESESVPDGLRDEIEIFIRMRPSLMKLWKCPKCGERRIQDYLGYRRYVKCRVCGAIFDTIDERAWEEITHKARDLFG